MKQDSVSLNQLCEKDRELLIDLYEKLKDLYSAMQEDLLLDSYYDQPMRDIMELATEIKNRTEGEVK